MGADWQKLRPLEQLMLDDNAGTNACVISAVFNFEGQITTEWAIKHVANRLVTHPRFSSVLEMRRGRAIFTPLPWFAESKQLIAHHVKTHDPSRFPPQPLALDAVVSEHLPLDKPLWKLHVFPGSFSTPSALVFRVHHCVGDGIGLLRFFLSAVADGPPVPITAPSLPLRRPLHDRLVLKRLIPVPRAVECLLGPLRDAFTIFVKPLIPDTASVFTRESPGFVKRAVFARPHDLAELATCARLVGVSINDLALAALVGALGRYALAHGDKPRNLRRVHIGVPVNNHAPGGENDTVVNAVSPLPLRAPILKEHRSERLALSAHRMRQVKHGLQPKFAMVAYSIVRALPPLVRLRLWRRLTRVCSALFTNVTGPQGKLQCGGKVVSDIRVLAPSQARAGLTVSAISYNGQFNVGFVCDARQVSEPEALADLINEELDALVLWTKGLAQGTENM